MKKLLPLFAALLLLLGCRNASIRYDLTIDATDTAQQGALALASMRVIEHRLEFYGEKPIDLGVDLKRTPPRITLSAKDPAILDVLTEDLVRPFKLRILKQAPPGEPEVLVVEGHGPFMETGLTEADVEWLEAAPDSLPEKGKVTITFTEEGRAKMATVFQKNKGKFIGIFIRDQLVAKLLVDDVELQDEIVITEIPSLDVAKVFTDDVNVGLHVTFVPVR